MDLLLWGQFAPTLTVKETKRKTFFPPTPTSVAQELSSCFAFSWPRFMRFCPGVRMTGYFLAITLGFFFHPIRSPFYITA